MLTANPGDLHRIYPRLPSPVKTALRDMYAGFIHISHSSLALLGTVIAISLVMLSARSDWRETAEQQLLGWLLQRQEVIAADLATPNAVSTQPGDTAPTTETPNLSLPKQQANVAQWLSRKYRVAPEPLSVLVAEAFAMGQKVRLDPTLILAVMAIESRFNPYAESPVGAQGLMQVLTRVHTEKYQRFGGQMAAFDPIANLRVGVKVLQDCIKQAGSVEGGLRLYVGAVTSDGSGYITKVMSEHLRIQSVALGKPMPTTFPTFPTAPVVPVVPVVAPAPPLVTPFEPLPDVEAEGPPSRVEPPETPLASS